MVSVTIRVDEETKKAAAAVAAEFGLDLSTMTRAFFRQVAREHRIPLNFGNYEPNAESLASIRESQRILAEGKAQFDTPDEMFEQLEI